MTKLSENYFKEIKVLVDQTLDKYIPATSGKIPPIILESMRYSLLAGGKRLRPALLIAAAEAVDGQRDKVLPFAAALEMIHTYTLIHDDLPALDNDDLRRGRPTNHKTFGEAIAILAGDALLTSAFEIMTNPSLSQNIPAEIILSVTHEISISVGIAGTIGGQVVDLQSEGKKVEFSTLKYIHQNKTAAMIAVAIRSGARLAGGKEDVVKSLSNFGEYIGLAFQIVDDILDVEGDQKILGKDVHSDQERGKATYPALVGLEESKKIARELTEKGALALNVLGGKGNLLKDIAYSILKRVF